MIPGRSPPGFLGSHLGKPELYQRRSGLLSTLLDNHRENPAHSAGFFVFQDYEAPMAKILMPKATAVWLIDNTTLTFEQIAEFCELHPLEVKGIADGEVAENMRGADPVASGELTREEIEIRFSISLVRSPSMREPCRKAM